MPVNPIVIDTTIQAYAEPTVTYGNILIIGRESGGSASDDEVKQCDSLNDVATYFGSTTDIYYAAVQAFNQGIARVWGIRVSQTAVAVESTPGAALHVLDNFPVSATPAPAIAGYTFEYTFGVPTDPGALKAMLNPLTGQIYINSAGPHNVAYSYTDWTAIEAIIAEEAIDIVCLAGAEGDAQWYGEVDSVLDICDTNKWILPMKSDPAADAADIVTDFGNYSSRNMLAVACKALGSNEDLNGALAGLIAQIEPWDKLMWKRINDITVSAYFTTSEVESTLEAGNVNAIILKQAAPRLSDGLTMAGGDYKYMDTTRTQYWLEEQIIDDLSLLMQNSRVPFTQTGIDIVQDTIEGTCDLAVANGALRSPWVDNTGQGRIGYTVQVPDFSDVADADRLDRILKNVYVTVWFAGHIQSITLNLAIQL